MKTKFLNLTILLCVAIIANAQISDTTYIVSFKDTIKDPGSGNIVKLQVVEDYSFLKNIPNIECDLFAVNSFKLNQYIQKDSVQNQMHLFVGVNEEKKEKYVVVDKNNNYDFSDDELHIFPLSGKPSSKEDREEKERMCVGLEIILDSQKKMVAHIGIDPFNLFSYKYGFLQDTQLEVLIFFRDYMQAKGLIENIPFEVDADVSWNLFDRKLNDKTKFLIRYNDKVNKLSYKTIKKGDTIQVQDHLLQLSKIEYPNIYLKFIGTLADSSGIGSFVPTLYSKDLEMNKDILINDIIKDKYVFVDFWGSWCGPCISSIPKLKGLYEKIKDREDVMLLGVALEKENDLDKLKAIINEKEIGWANLWIKSEDSRITASIIKKLDIKAYPTYLIIDNTGEIVYKEQSMYKTEEAIDFLLNLIDK